MKTKIDRIWSISLIVIGLATFILAGSSVIGMEFPDIVVRIIGVIDLIALPVLVYSSLKKVKIIIVKQHLIYYQQLLFEILKEIIYQLLPF